MIWKGAEQTQEILEMSINEEGGEFYLIVHGAVFISPISYAADLGKNSTLPDTERGNRCTHFCLHPSRQGRFPHGSPETNLRCTLKLFLFCKDAN